MKLNNTFWFLIFIIFSFCIYYNSLNNNLVLDDSRIIRDNIFITSLKYFPFYLKGRVMSDPAGPILFRPLAMISYNLNYLISGYNLWSYRVLNILVQGLNGFLLYLLLLSISGSCNRKLALLLGLLFIVHPINTEAVNYLSSRADILIVTFCLCLIIFFLNWINTGNRKYLFLSFLFTLLAYLTKEYAVIIPVLIFLLLIRYRKFRQQFPIFLLHILLGWIVVFYYWMIHRQEVYEYIPPNLISNLSLQFKVAFLYLKLFFYPRGLSIFHQVAPFDFWGFFMLGLGLGIIFLLGMRYKNSNFLLGIILFWICLLPKSLVNLTFPAMERHFYFPQMGIWLSLFAVLNRFEFRKILLPVSMIVVIFIPVTISRNKVWEKGKTIWLDAWRKNCNAWQVQFPLGLIYLREGEYKLAEKFLYSSLEGCKEAKFCPEIIKSIVELYRREGNLKKAKQILKAMSRVYPRDYTLMHTLGLVYFQENKLHQAEEYYLRALSINSLYFQSIYNLGLLYYRKGDYDRAKKYLQECVKIYPLFDLPYLYLGVISEKNGDISFAVYNYKKAIECNSKRAEAYFALGSVYAKMLDRRAELYLKKAIEIRPQMAEAWYNLGLFYLQTGAVKKAVAYVSKAEMLGFQIPDIVFSILNEKRK